MIESILESNEITLASEITIPVKRSWGAFALAIIESICVFYVGASHAGLLVGSTALSILGVAEFMHRDIFRVPVIIVAIVGALINLWLLWNAHRLRNAPAAAWRKRPLNIRERRRIAIVLSLSVATLAMATWEIWLHREFHHTIM